MSRDLYQLQCCVSCDLFAELTVACYKFTHCRKLQPPHKIKIMPAETNFSESSIQLTKSMVTKNKHINWAIKPELNMIYISFILF